MSMFEKKVPGFCTNLLDALELLGIENLNDLDDVPDVRKHVKGMLVETQKKRLLNRMMEGSKTDGMLKNFEYDGRMKQYLHVLPYNEARIVFMLRAKMFPTKWNFPNRWSMSKLCLLLST